MVSLAIRQHSLLLENSGWGLFILKNPQATSTILVKDARLTENTPQFPAN